MSRPTTELGHLVRALRAPAAARALPKLADRREEQWSYEQVAATLLKPETDSRDRHGGQARSKAARFPARKTLEEFDFACQTSLRRDPVRSTPRPPTWLFMLVSRRYERASLIVTTNKRSAPGATSSATTSPPPR